MKLLSKLPLKLTFPQRIVISTVVFKPTYTYLSEKLKVDAFATVDIDADDQRQCNMYLLSVLQLKMKNSFSVLLSSVDISISIGVNSIDFCCLLKRNCACCKSATLASVTLTSFGETEMSLFRSRKQMSFSLFLQKVQRNGTFDLSLACFAVWASATII